MTSDQSPMGRIADALEVLPGGVAALRADVHTAEKARKKANRINTVLLVIAVLLLGVVGVVGWQVRETNKRIADCTTVGGGCYEEGRTRTGQAVSSLTYISILVSQCGRLYLGESGREYDRKLEACVYQRLGEIQSGTPPTPGPSPSSGPSSSSPRPSSSGN